LRQDGTNLPPGQKQPRKQRPPQQPQGAGGAETAPDENNHPGKNRFRDTAPNQRLGAAHALARPLQ
jgi:hypothetical protein